MNQQICAMRRCNQPTAGATFCRGCEDTLAQQVAELPALATDLDIAITRQAVITQAARTTPPRPGRDEPDSKPLPDGAAEWPLPYDDTASRAAAVLTARAWTWVMTLWDSSEPLPTRHLEGIGQWLYQRINRILDHPDVAELADDIDRQFNHARRIIDRPAERIFAGICSALTPKGECLTWLYANPGRPLVTCPTCGASHDVAYRREVLRQAAENVLATAAEIARAVTWLGDHVRADRIRQWAKRGRLPRRGTEDGRPLYRIGDVLNLLAADQQKAS